MADKITEEIFGVEVDKIMTYNTKALEVEEDSIIIYIPECDCRKRVYFNFLDKDMKEFMENKSRYINRPVTIEYTGDITDMVNIKILPLKNLF